MCGRLSKPESRRYRTLRVVLVRLANAKNRECFGATELDEPACVPLDLAAQCASTAEAARHRAARNRDSVSVRKSDNLAYSTLTSRRLSAASRTSPLAGTRAPQRGQKRTDFPNPAPHALQMGPG